MKIQRKWSAADERYLCENYHRQPANVTAEALNRSLVAVYCRASHLQLKPYNPTYRDPPTYEAVVEIVREELRASRSHNVMIADVLSDNRSEPLAWIRARAYRRLRQMGHSYAGIGKAFGRDHAPVRDALRRQDLDRPPIQKGDRKYRRARLLRFAAQHARVSP